MPIYEYECAKCSQVIEAMRKFSDPPLTKCPNCGGRLSKLMSMNSFQLKGGGWYVTDYAHKKTDSPTSKPHGEAKSADKPAETAAKTADAPAKPAAAKETAPKA